MWDGEAHTSKHCTRKEMFYLMTHSVDIFIHREREMFYLTTHSKHFINGYMASDIWLRTILIVRKETRCRHIGYSFRLTARVLLYAPSHRQDSTYHSLCYTSCGALAGTRNSSVGSPHEGSIRWPIAPWANALTTELHLAPQITDEAEWQAWQVVWRLHATVIQHEKPYSKPPGCKQLLPYFQDRLTMQSHAGLTNQTSSLLPSLSDSAEKTTTWYI